MWVPLKPEYLHDYDAIVWWGGNHAIDNNYATRYGVHDATLVAKGILQPQCGAVLRDSQKSQITKKVVWLDTHVRQGHGSYCPLKFHNDEKLPVVQRYREELPKYLEEICDIHKIASVWEASYQLVMTRFEEAETMTFDRVHWGMQLNLLKAHAIIHQILLQ